MPAKRSRSRSSARSTGCCSKRTAPVPVRGTRNDSRSVRYIAEKLAALRGLDTDELIRLTAENGKRLFGIG